MRLALIASLVVFALGPAPGATIGITPIPAAPEPPVDESVFPPGPERQFIIDTCQGCHTLNMVSKNGGDIADWSSRLVRMIRAGAPIPRAQIPALATYLAKAFPVRPRPNPPDR